MKPNQQELANNMKIKYQFVKTLQPFCGNCGEQLAGCNSSMQPYYCTCGVWRSTPYEPDNFKLQE